MTQQTIDVQINLPAETIPEDLMQPVRRTGAADQPEVAWNPPASMGCRNTGIHHVGLHAANPALSAEFYRDVLGMEIVGGSAPDDGASGHLDG